MESRRFRREGFADIRSRRCEKMKVTRHRRKFLASPATRRHPEKERTQTTAEMAKARTKAARALAKKQGKKSVGEAKPSATKKSAVRSRHSSLCTAPCAPTLRLLMSISSFVCCSAALRARSRPWKPSPPWRRSLSYACSASRTALHLRAAPHLASQPCACCSRSQASCAVVTRRRIRTSS